MNFTYASLDPVPVTKPGTHAAAELRTHQGIPSMERTAKGRLFAVWYAGGTTECRDNYVMMVVSDDDGKTWSDALWISMFLHDYTLMNVHIILYGNLKSQFSMQKKEGLCASFYDLKMFLLLIRAC